jgi:hypothetical protein
MMHSGDRSARPMLRGARELSLGRAALVLALGLAFAVTLAACSHMPWSKKAAAAPEPVNELTVTGADGSALQGFPQYWKRNTLVVDLSGASGSGALVLKPGESGKWPVRVAFRVSPGSIGLLEVQADQRMLLPVAREGAKPIDLELVPGVYTAATPQVRVRWEPAR